jgi:hypothetical protein
LEINKSDFIKIIGIGAFLFLSIIEFSSLAESIMELLQIAMTSQSFGLQWLPDLLGLFIFSVLAIWTFHNIEKLLKVKLKKLLSIMVLVFFGILLLQFIRPFLGTEYILRNYTEEFSAFYEARRDSNAQVIIGISQILKYMAFVFVLYFKTIANNTSYEKL